MLEYPVLDSRINKNNSALVQNKVHTVGIDKLWLLDKQTLNCLNTAISFE